MTFLYLLIYCSVFICSCIIISCRFLCSSASGLDGTRPNRYKSNPFAPLFRCL